MRYLAIDYGTKTTGLAICDPGEKVVSPLAALNTDKNLLNEILRFIKTENVDAVILGLPLNMDGSVGPQAKIVQDFAHKLTKQLDVPVSFQDERLTSFAAREKLASRGLTRAKKRSRLDALAAAEILQSFLDSKPPPAP